MRSVNLKADIWWQGANRIIKAHEQKAITHSCVDMDVVILSVNAYELMPKLRRDFPQKTI
jgi:hypothetical protein